MELLMTTASTPLTVRPLSQSRQAKMACAHLYHITQVQGLDLPESSYATRGTEIHRVLAAYIEHLVATRQSTDYSRFAELLEGIGEEARAILEDYGQVFVLDPEKVLATELKLQLGEDFLPCPAGYPAAYEGTLDLVLLHTATEAEIPDWKSYFQVIRPDTFQSKLYPLLLMCHYPHLEKVTFRLEFVRYGVGREVSYTRADLPKLQELAKRERARQLELHGLAAPPPATPGSHCVYCPLLRSRSCPIGEQNPRAQMTPEDRLRFQLYLDQASRENTALLKEYINVNGPVEAPDGNGQLYAAGFKLAVSQEYPADVTLEVLKRWQADSGEELLSKLRIGSTELKPLAKAKKRAALAEQLEQVKTVVQSTRFTVGKVSEEE
jgi:hypothetical protein